MRLKIPLKAPIQALNKCHASVVTVYWPPAKTGNLASLSQGASAQWDAICISLQNVLTEHYKRVHAFNLLEDSRFVVDVLAGEKKKKRPLLFTNKKTVSSLTALEKLPESHRRTQTSFIELEMLAEVPRQPLKFNRISRHQRKTRALRRIRWTELESRPVIWEHLIKPSVIV